MASPARKYTSISVIILFLLIFMIWWDSNGASPPDEPNPECPHDYKGHPLALSGNITNIPEFHDCQRLIERDGKTYGTLAGVFAREGLADLHIATDTLEVTPVVDSAGTIHATVNTNGDTTTIAGSVATSLDQGLRIRSIALAEIRSYDRAYDPLGISQGLNCLYIVRIQLPNPLPYIYRALMINNVADDQTCLHGPPATGGKWLVVHHSGPPASSPPYPAVARWDWDDNVTLGTPSATAPALKHNKQYISMFCDRDWCDVGDADLIPIQRNEVNLGSSTKDAVWEQKGRYDEQRLAVGNPGLQPSDVKASAFPTAELESYTLANYQAGWQHVANTVLPTPLEIYRTKFNYGQGSIPGVTNQVSLCAGWRFHCLPFFTALGSIFTLRCWKSDGDGDPATTDDQQIWWARITNSDGSNQYRCVWRRVHPGVTPPTAARWRWKKADEGLWVRCEVGCCEVEEKS